MLGNIILNLLLGAVGALLGLVAFILVEPLMYPRLLGTANDIAFSLFLIIGAAGFIWLGQSL